LPRSRLQVTGQSETPLNSHGYSIAKSRRRLQRAPCFGPSYCQLLVVVLPSNTIHHVKWANQDEARQKIHSDFVINSFISEDANAAKRCGLAWNGRKHSARLYDSRFQIRRCTNCQRFDHHGTQCSSPARCGYCANHHQTKYCPSPERPTPVRELQTRA